jgi:hypothetical protein
MSTLRYSALPLWRGRVLPRPVLLRRQHRLIAQH